MIADVPPARGDAAGLAAALGAADLPCDVEARAGLAIVRVGGARVAGLADAARRGEVLALAKRCGFTHVAVELADDPLPAGAAVLRD